MGYRKLLVYFLSLLAWTFVGFLFGMKMQKIENCILVNSVVYTNGEKTIVKNCTFYSGTDVYFKPEEHKESR